MLNHAFVQNLTINPFGVGDIKMFQAFDNKAKHEYIKPISLFKNYEKIKLFISSKELFDYYFFDSDSLTLENDINVRSLFFAVNKQNIVMGIFCFVNQNFIAPLKLGIAKNFDESKLMSTSGENYVTSRSKIFWSKNNISVFLANTIYNKPMQLSFQFFNDERMPGIACDDYEESEE